jgi:CRISPR-associated protein Csb1
MIDTPRTILKIRWDSLLDFVQAAKFKDVGNSTWQESGTQSVLLASPQCFANLLEEVAVRPQPGAGLVPCLEELPYIRLVDAEDRYLASSLDLPHRLASGHIASSKHLKDFRKRLQDQIAKVGIHQAGEHIIR